MANANVIMDLLEMVFGGKYATGIQKQKKNQFLNLAATFYINMSLLPIIIGADLNYCGILWFSGVGVCEELAICGTEAQEFKYC